MPHKPFSALVTLPAGSDAEKGFYAFGVGEGEQLNITQAGYTGGDSVEVYQLMIIPVGATSTLSDVAIDQSLGMVPLFSQMKGGATAPMAEPPVLFGTQPVIVPGPCSLVICASAANTAAFVVSIWGTVSPLGESL